MWGQEEVATLFVTGLPDDATEEEARAAFELEGAVASCSSMKRGPELVAFVRFESVGGMRRAMQQVLAGKVKVCGAVVKAEVARQNTAAGPARIEHLHVF